MEDEIFEEVDIEVLDQSIDDSGLVDSVEEVEGSDSFTQDELISALLSLMNEEREASDELQDEAETFGLPVEDPEPLQVLSVNDVDYSDLLLSIDSRLENLETVVLSNDETNNLDTPLMEYSLTNILLVCCIVILFITIGYHFIKDNLLHF